jgi:ankyrin repeat protein
VKVDNEDQQG